MGKSENLTLFPMFPEQLYPGMIIHKHRTLVTEDFIGAMDNISIQEIQLLLLSTPEPLNTPTDEDLSLIGTDCLGERLRKQYLLPSLCYLTALLMVVMPLGLMGLISRMVKVKEK